MNVPYHISPGKIAKIFRRPGFWSVVSLFILLTILYYLEYFSYPVFIVDAYTSMHLSRNAFERVLFLVPIVCGGLLFGWVGSLVISIAALAAILLGAARPFENTGEVIFESVLIFFIGNALAISLYSLWNERANRLKFEEIKQQLQASEARYNSLFENAHDAIWLHDLDGNIIAANQAAARLLGYSVEELLKMNVRTFLSDESLVLAKHLRVKLLRNEPVQQPYDQRMYRRDGSEALVQLSTSLVFNMGRPTAFQHIARDVTEQKRMQDDLRFYLLQVTKAQEEERKRISHELHDETIQALVVLSRQLDALASGDNNMPENVKNRLEELWQRTNNILSEVRRLSQDLRPATLDRLGLIPGLDWLAADVGKYSKIEVKVKSTGVPRRLPEEVELVLFRITQEALTNVWRHSGATRADVAVAFSDRNVRISISDNGKGFKLPEKMGDLARSGKLGLAGMQERAQLLGGTLTVKSKPNEGTVVTIVASV
jgi:PAS domain S-box-containing protein